MKKKIVIISIALMAFAVALAGNSWAERERGGNRHTDRGARFNGADNPVDRGHFRGRGPAHIPRRDFNRPGPRFKHKSFKRHHYRPAHRFKHKSNRWRHHRKPYRFQPKFRRWRHRPVYRHGHPRHYKWRHRRSMVQEINNYYSNAEDDTAPLEEFQASASVSDSGFSISVGTSKTN